ncbi:hypothetical protein GRX03_09775 [Halovenus sp. WSH3]|uniref:Uncharacterized protein n=1 Tax=Halovenus carboxidivorans TaxID=2692199 RepID=A0A6B0T9H0_9EURY|nr:hypothetical protein [Halovenus carboxidivorans]MXR51891.1 hypothetical protein [Halovenus carboxidivorans]
MIAGLASTSRPGPGFVVVLVAASVVTVAAALVAWRYRQRGTVVAFCLLGAVGVVGQVAIVRTDPLSRLGFVLGTTGGWLWYLGWLAAGRGRAQAERGVAVGGLLWVAGAVTVTISLAGVGWPVQLSLAGGALAGVVTAAYSRLRADGWRQPGIDSVMIGAAFVGPAVVGRAFGTEVVFVLSLLWTVLGVLGWYLAGLFGSSKYRSD